MPTTAHRSAPITVGTPSLLRAINERTILDPEMVILGGGIGRNGDLLVEPIERELRQLLPFRPAVAVSALGEDAVVRGAIATALDVARDRVFARSPVRHVREAVG